MSLHRRLEHPEYVEGCFGCKISTVQLSTGAANSNPARKAVAAREARWNRDMPAYKRLRDQGLQPPRIDGCADLERDSSTRFEIESGQAFPGREKQVAEAVSFVEDLTGKPVTEAVTTPKEQAVSA